MLFRLLPVALVAACIAGPAAAQLPPGKNRPADVDPSIKQAPQAPQKFPIDLQWTLVSLTGKQIPAERPSVQIDSQFRARGFGGCNTFSATAIPQPGQRFAVGPIAQTKKACAPGVNEFERAFLIAFRTAVFWGLKDGYLVFAGPGGELKFERGL
jgi:heat shock protein HslJ